MVARGDSQALRVRDSREAAGVGVGTAGVVATAVRRLPGPVPLGWTARACGRPSWNQR